MGRAFGMCAGIAFTAACGLSVEYQGPSGGGVGGIGGNGVSGSAGSNGGRTGGSAGNGVGSSTNGGNGVVAGINGSATGLITSAGNGPGGNGPGGNGPGGNGPGGNGPGGNGTNGNGTIGPGGSTGRMGNSSTGTGGRGNTGGGTCSGELEPCNQGDGGPSCCDNEKLTCTTEPSAGSAFCEKTCKKASDCENAQTVCSAGTCVLNVCGGSSSNGSYDGICSSGNVNGTCVPKETGTSEYGICFAGGPADGGCSETAPKGATDLCIAGDACGPNPSGPGEICFTLCPPGFGEGGKAVCFDAGYLGGCFQLGAGDLGVCF